MDMKKRILLVDDEPELRRMVASLLTGAGYEVAELSLIHISEPTRPY